MTERQTRFLAFYLGPEAYRNASRAARLAGYAWPDRQGPMLARHPAFARQIRDHLAGVDAPPPRIGGAVSHAREIHGPRRTAGYSTHG